MSSADLDAFLASTTSEARSAILTEIANLRLECDAMRGERDRWQRAARWLWRMMTEEGW